MLGFNQSVEGVSPAITVPVPALKWRLVLKRSSILNRPQKSLNCFRKAVLLVIFILWYCDILFRNSDGKQCQSTLQY